MWHEVQRGAPETGEVPVTAWQLPQSAVKVEVVVCVCVAVVNGTAWFGCDGPFRWQLAATPDALVNEAVKQLGAPAKGPAPGPVTAWQTAQATFRFPESLWEAT